MTVAPSAPSIRAGRPGRRRATPATSSCSVVPPTATGAYGEMKAELDTCQSLRLRFDTCQDVRVPTTELSAETRGRILDAAFATVRTHGAAALSVKGVAADAGVSRQLVYFHYANRAGLLLAMARHHDARSGFAERVAAAGTAAPVPALEALLRAWLDYVPEILPVARALEAALITGDEGGAAWRDRMAELHAVLGRAVDRIDRDGRLAPGWDAAAATDWIWARVQPAAWAHLVDERGWTAEAFSERTVAGLLAECVTAP